MSLPLPRTNDDRELFFIAGEGWGEGEPLASPHPNPLPPLSSMFLLIFLAGEGAHEAALVNVPARMPAPVFHLSFPRKRESIFTFNLSKLSNEIPAIYMLIWF